MPKSEELDDGHGWIPFNGKITEHFMKTAKVCINGKVYDEYTEDLMEQYWADKAWDRLM